MASVELNFLHFFKYSYLPQCFFAIAFNMKIKIFFINCIVLISSSVGLSFKEFHGGDSVAVEWYSLSAKIILDLYKIPVRYNDAIRFQNINTKLNIQLTEDPLFINGVEKAAISIVETENDDLKNIVINVKQWHTLSDNSKELLIIHEYLNLSAIVEDSEYIFSRSLFNDLLKSRDFFKSNDNYQNYIFKGFDLCLMDDHFFSILSLNAEIEVIKKNILYIQSHEQICQPVQNMAAAWQKVVNDYSHSGDIRD